MENSSKRSLSWDEVMNGSKMVVRTDEDLVELFRLVDSIDPATIPPEIKFPDLNPD